MSNHGAHVPLEPMALSNGIAILRSAMDYGFVDPIDIPPEQFHPELQSTALLIRNAIGDGATGFAEIYQYLLRTTEPGDAQELARAKISEYGDGAFGVMPSRLAGEAQIVRNHHLVKSRVLAGWRLQRKLEAGEDIADELRQLTELEAGNSGSDGLVSRLAARAFNHAIIPPKPIPIFTIAEMPLCTPGNITNIQALPKAGKSAVVESMIAAVFNGRRRGPDTLGFSGENMQGHALVHFDTEQSRFDHDGLLRRSLRRAQIDSPPDWLVSYSVANLDIGERRQALRHTMREAARNHGGVFAVMIDGVADLCGDPNDAEEAFALVGELHALAITYDCTIVTVLHENPGSETGKTRGHLGSQLERKAETNLRLAKDTAGITTIWAERARHCHLPKEKGSCFAWNNELSMHTSCGTAGEMKSAANREKLEADAGAAFGDTESFRHSDLLEAVCSAFDLKERAAKDRVRKWAAEGVIRKDSLGKYRLQNP